LTGGCGRAIGKFRRFTFTDEISLLYANPIAEMLGSNSVKLMCCQTSLRNYACEIMLVPLTRQKFEELIPRVATSDQYRYSWGKLPDFLRRLLISVAGVVAASVLQLVLGDDLWWISFTLGFAAGFYWLWSPVYLASRRNLECRSYRYSGFWQGRVLDRYVSEELVGKEETVNKLGELVIVENRERRLNLIVGDDAGFETKLVVSLKRDHRAIRVDDLAELVVMSSRSDLSRIAKVSEVYLPECNLWISDYPYIRHDSFLEMRKELGRRRDRRR
jgi:hypothetical protein